MIVYNYDTDGLYAGKSTAPSSPREPGKFFIPANSTPLPNPEFGKNQIAKFVNGSWEVVPDFRGSEFWLSDGTHHVIIDVGIELPNGALFEPPPPEPEEHQKPPTVEEIKTSLLNSVQTMLDETARERNYDGILSACSYIASANPKFADEAIACVLWRDAVWAECYALLEKVMAGKMAIPTEEELIAMLPKMEWPA